jgi:Replication terminator protein.
MESEVRGRGFLLKQRAFLKLYLITMIENDKGYGNQFYKELERKFESKFGFSPTNGELYKALYDLMEDGIVDRYRQRMADKDLKEIFIYRIKDKDLANAYRSLMKVELDRCIGLLKQAIEDNYA